MAGESGKPCEGGTAASQHRGTGCRHHPATTAALATKIAGAARCMVCLFQKILHGFCIAFASKARASSNSSPGDRQPLARRDSTDSAAGGHGMFRFNSVQSVWQTPHDLIMNNRNNRSLISESRYLTLFGRLLIERWTSSQHFMTVLRLWVPC